MAHTVRARTFKDEAIKDALTLQRAHRKDGFVFTVEHDSWKQPYPYRVIRYGLGTGETVPGLYEWIVTGVRCVFVARALDATKLPRIPREPVPVEVAAAIVLDGWAA
jgi:hypothetical protein